MNKIKLFLLIASLLFGFSMAKAQEERFGIAAIVNNYVITNHDIENRAKLLFLDSGLPKNAENFERLRRVGRAQLIDEALQLQQVRDLGVSVSDIAVENLISNLEERNNLPAGGFRNLMQQNEVDYDHFVSQQYLRLAWNNFLQREFQRSGGVTKSEIENYIKEVEARQGGQEVRLREIFLPYRSPLLAAKTNALGQEILARLSNGADFATLANSFSAARSAADGGDIGWVPLNFLDEKIRSEASELQIGQVSGLIENITGIMILKLEDKRILGTQALATATDANQVEITLRNQKIDLLHRQNLYRLKSDAFIELR